MEPRIFEQFSLAKLSTIRAQTDQRPALAAAKTKRLRTCRSLPQINSNANLVERVRNRREGGLQLGAEALNDGNDGNGDARGDQAILDGGRTGLSFTKRETRFFILVAP